MMNLMVQLTDNDKRLIICVLLVFILAFVLAGFVGILVKKIMNFQAKRADDMLYDVVRTGVISKPSKLRLYGYRKNVRLFMKQAWIPFCILVLGIATYFICSAAYGHLINLHDYGQDPHGVEGFTPTVDNNGIIVGGGEGWMTAFFIWDLKSPQYGTFFGIKLISGFPLLSKPHFEAKALPALIFFFTMIIGGIWFFVVVQAYIARSFRIWKLSKTVFSKSLENVTGNDLPVNKGGASVDQVMNAPAGNPDNSQNNNQ